MNNPKYIDLVIPKTYIHMLATSVLQVSSWQFIFGLAPCNIFKAVHGLVLSNGVYSFHTFNPHVVHYHSQSRQPLFVDAFIVVF